MGKDTSQTDVQPLLEDKLKEITQGVVKVENKAKKVVITKESDMAEATNVLAFIKGSSKKLEEWRQFFVKPLNDQVKSINKLFKEKSVPLAEAEQQVKRAIGDFRMEQNRIAEAEELRLRKLQDKRQERAKASGKDIDPTPAPVVERPQTTVQTKAGKTTTRKVWKFKMLDVEQVPKSYLVVDERLIRKAIADGVRNIKGVEIYEDVEVSVSV